MIDMNRLKNLKDGTIPSIALIVIGAIFLLLPGTSLKLVLRLGAIFLVVTGVLQLLDLKKRNEKLDFTNPEFVRCVAFAAGGAVMFFLPGLVERILPWLAGACIIYAGAMQLIPVLKTWKDSPQKDYKQLIVPAVTLLIGVLILLKPFGSLRLLLRIAGAALIWYGVTSLMQKTNGSQTPPPAI